MDKQNTKRLPPPSPRVYKRDEVSGLWKDDKGNKFELEGHGIGRLDLIQTTAKKARAV